MTGYVERKDEDYATRIAQTDRDGRYTGLVANADAIVRLATEFMESATALHTESNAEEKSDVISLRADLIARASAVLTP